MTVYDSMAPFEAKPVDDTKVLERPMLHISTPETTPTQGHDLDFDWGLGGHGWRSQVKPDSPQSLPSLDHPSPTSEDLSQLPKCRKCGLTTKQHHFVQAFICGHLCRDIPQEKFCPDIDAIKDCPIHNPKRRHHMRRRSSLANPPMIARDESTYNDLDEGQMPVNVTESPVEQYEFENNEGPQQTKEIKDDQSSSPKKPRYHVSRSPDGDADWRKHCRVEKAMQQMLFGNAKVSAHVVLEHTQKLRASNFRAKGDMSTAQDTNSDDDDDLRSAMAAAHLHAEKHSDKCEGRGVTHGEGDNKQDSSNLPQADSPVQNRECAICSDEEDEAEDEFQDALSAVNPATKARGCASDDECSSCVDEGDLHVDSRDFAPEEPPQMWMDRSRAC